QVIVDGEPKALTPKECKLFRTLLDCAGRVVLKQELMDVVWGDNYAVDEHTLNVHIWKLRQKIEQDPSQPTLIVTMRGIGYRLIAEQQARKQDRRADYLFTPLAYDPHGEMETSSYVQLPVPWPKSYEPVGA